MSDSKKQQFTVALIYDFDGTLAAGNMQEYDFIPAVGKSNKEFWSDANKMAEEQDADQILTYMALMIREAQAKGLSLRREAFQESGRKVVLYPGVEEWFERINSYGESQGDYRGNNDSRPLPEDIRLLIPLQCGRHCVLAGCSGKLYQ